MRFFNYLSVVTDVIVLLILSVLNFTLRLCVMVPVTVFLVFLYTLVLIFCSKCFSSDNDFNLTIKRMELKMFNNQIKFFKDTFNF